MATNWLADEDPASAWSRCAWPTFTAAASDPRAVAILPLFGFADHGMGLPLDAEEVVGSAILRSALSENDAVSAKVLPPLRWVLGPYRHCAFGIDPDAAHAQLQELASGIRDAGFARLLFFNSSPWNAEWIDAASRDVRHKLGIQTFIVHLGALGLDFHPASAHRSSAARAVSALLGLTPHQENRPYDVRDADFRPGQFHEPQSVTLSGSEDPSVALARAAGKLNSLLSEIVAHPPLRAPANTTPARGSSTAPKKVREVSAKPFPATYRTHYLCGLTRREIEEIPEKEKAWVLLPTAAIEQHGHHLPVGVDAIIGQGYLSEAFRQAGMERVWVAPPITFGKSTEHIGFPGTLSVSAQTLRHLVRVAVAQLHRWGFRQIAVLNSHGGNTATLVYTLRELQVEFPGRLGMLNHLFRPDLSPQEAANGFHAGEYETSVMLALAPELVAMDKAVCEFPARIDDPGELRPENGAAIISWLSSDISKSGVMGDATSATMEKGRYWLGEYGKSIARRLNELG